MLHNELLGLSINLFFLFYILKVNVVIQHINLTTILIQLYSSVNSFLV